MPGSDSLSILDGSTFVVSNHRGDIEARADQPHGLFYRDTRFLSRWRLTLDDGLTSDPALPDGITRLVLRGVSVRGRHTGPATSRPARRANGARPGERIPVRGGRS
jgi:hypothetical protein